MVKTFKMGDHVSLNFKAGGVRGLILRVHAHCVNHKGYTCHVC